MKGYNIAKIIDKTIVDDNKRYLMDIRDTAAYKEALGDMFEAGTFKKILETNSLMDSNTKPIFNIIDA